MFRHSTWGMFVLLSLTCSTSISQERPVHRVELVHAPLFRLKTERERTKCLITIDPRGKQLIGVTAHGKGRVWDLESGRVLRRFRVPQRVVGDMVFSPDASKLAMHRYAPDRVSIWGIDGETRSQTISIPKKILPISSILCFASHGEKILIGTMKGELYLGDIEKATLDEFSLRESSVRESAKLSPNGKWLLARDRRRLSDLYDLAQTPPKTYPLSTKPILEDEDDPLTHGVFTTDSQSLFLMRQQGSLARYDLSAHKLHKLDKSPKCYKAESLSVSADGRFLAMAGVPEERTGQKIHLVDSRTGEDVVLYDNETRKISQTVFSPNGELLVSTDEEGEICVWPVPLGRLRAYRPELAPGINRVQHLHFADAGRLLLASTRSGKVCLWDVHTEQRLATLDGHRGRICGFAVAPSRNLFATAGRNRLVKVWTVENEPKLLYQFAQPNLVTCLAFSPDESFLALGDNKGQLHIWDMIRRQSQVPLLANTGPIYALKYHPKGRWLVSGGSDGSVRLWDIARREKVHTLHLGKVPVLSFAFLDQGDRLAIGAGQGRLALWDVHKRKPLDEIVGLGFEIRSLAVTSNHRLLASTSENFTAVLERSAAGKLRPPRKFCTTSRCLRTLAIAPDGRTLATADANGCLELRSLRAK